MERQILEGTLKEVQRQMSRLQCEPETRVRVIIEEAEAQTPSTRTRNGITLVPASRTGADAVATAAASAEPFHATEFRNGVPLLPRRKVAEPITTEFVKRLLDEEDEESLRAYRTPGR